MFTHSRIHFTTQKNLINVEEICLPKKYCSQHLPVPSSLCLQNQEAVLHNDSLESLLTLSPTFTTLVVFVASVHQDQTLKNILLDLDQQSAFHRYSM